MKTKRKQRLSAYEEKKLSVRKEKARRNSAALEELTTLMGRIPQISTATLVKLLARGHYSSFYEWVNGRRPIPKTSQSLIRLFLSLSETGDAESFIELVESLRGSAFLKELEALATSLDYLRGLPFVGEEIVRRLLIAINSK